MNVSHQKHFIADPSKKKYCFSSNTPTKCCFVVFGLLFSGGGLVAGAVLGGLGGYGFFGAVGSAGFIATTTGGATLCLLAIASIALCILLGYKRSSPPSRLIQEDYPSHSAIIATLKNRLAAKDNALPDLLKEIPSSFFDLSSHARAKMVFSEAMREILGESVEFPRPGSLPTDWSCSEDEELDTEVFSMHISKQGVEVHLPAASNDTKHIHLFQVASQFNGAEASSKFTPKVGEAMKKSKHDSSQGPLAQRTNPAAFELVTAFLANLGFNMLFNVQDPSAVEHGYLEPTEENLDVLTNSFTRNYSKAEYVCYSSLNPNWEGDAPVYLFLQAAPKISPLVEESSEELQRYAALANYLAFFRHGITLAQRHNMPIILHATAIGGGSFGNATENISWGFKTAALALQAEMKEHNVFVQLEVFKDTAWEEVFGISPMESIGNGFNLPIIKDL